MQPTLFEKRPPFRVRVTHRRWDAVFVLGLAAAVIFLHFRLVGNGTAALTAAPFATIGLLIWAAEPQISRRWAVSIIALLAVPALIFIIDSGSSGIEFVKTYIQWAFSTFVIVFAIAAPLARSVSFIAPACRLALGVVCLYGVIQVVSLQAFGTPLFYNPFGTHQYLSQYDLLLHSRDPRAPVFYLEPSFAALVVTTCYFGAVSDGQRIRWSTLFAIAGLLAIKSLAGFVVFGVLIIWQAKHVFSKEGRVISVFGIVLSALAADRFGLFEFIFRRSASGAIDGSSTYYRLIAPLPVLRDILLHSPLGAVFGSLNATIGKYGLLNGNRTGTSLDNGVYVLVFYFGWFALAAFVWIAIAVITGPAQTFWRRLFLFIFGTATVIYTGGIFGADFILLAVIAILAWRGRVQEVNQ